jgi:formylglycine-generating enzyme required for sulfatase activity
LSLIRRQLRPWRDQAVPALWRAARDAQGDAARQLRLAAALADCDADGDGWGELAPPVADRLVAENPLLLRQWVDLLWPARRRLIPPLQVVFRDAGRGGGESAVATSVLADYAADRPDVLIELVADAAPAQFRELFGTLEPFRGAAVARFEAELAQAAPAGPPDGARERLAKRQRNAAVALFRLGRPDRLWPLLRHSPDPELRSQLVHALAPLGADPLPLLRHWDEERDPSARRALLLALGEFGRDRLPPEARQALTDRLLTAYRAEPDAGLRSAAEWLLRAWGAGDRLKAIDDELRGRPGPPPGQWSVNSEGHTMVRIDARNSPAMPTGRRVDRCFAVATKEVTFGQFLRFRQQHKVWVPGGDREMPAGELTWYDAAAYCRWLSDREELPEDQKCYPPIDQIKDGMRPYADCLRRTGYRLPTAAELEYACRAGAVTARFFGWSDDLLPHYAWFERNTGQFPKPVGRLKPNDFGLFDSLGNMSEWCHEPSPDAAGAVAPGLAPVRDGAMWLVLGGSATFRAQYVVYGRGDDRATTSRWRSIGFRIVRTCAPDEARRP